MRILVLGSSGLLGCTLVPELEWLGHEIVAPTRGPHPGGPGDLRTPGAVETVLDRSGCEAAVNLVAMADVDACEQMPEAAMQLNGHLPGRLASACAERGISCVQVSTDMVYDGPGPHAEFDVVPLNVYARTKLEGDARVVDAGGCVLRTNFFGTSRHRSRRSFSDWLLEGFRADRELPLLGDVFFSPLRMESLCAWIGTVLRDPANGEVLNLGSRTGMTKRDFALKLANACGHANVRERPVTLQELRLAARRPTDMRMDVGKFEERYRTELPSLGQEIEIAARVGTGADLPWESSRGNSGSPTSLRAEEEGKR